ncbi:MAG: hypothetical protein ABRQ39_24705 [Candidatus Eremiobacterota bacterium]
MNMLSDEHFNLFKELVTLTYGTQEDIDKRSKENKLYSVIIIKPVEQLNDAVIEHYSMELKGTGINNSTWDEKLWAFRATVMGTDIQKIKEKGFIVLLDRKVEISPLSLPP